MLYLFATLFQEIEGGREASRAQIEASNVQIEALRNQQIAQQFSRGVELLGDWVGGEFVGGRYLSGAG